MQIAPVYRLRVTEIPNNPGVEIFPTVEVIDRLYPPPGLAQRFPIPIELTLDEVELAARGSFVTRVIYVEDPHTALPIAQPASGDQPWVEARPGGDPLVEADERGRPVAILRMGGRIPNSNSLAEEAEYAPPFVMFDPNKTCLQEGQPASENEQSIPVEQHEEPVDVEPLYPAKLNRPDPGTFIR
jgi:hypothetical protein